MRKYKIYLHAAAALLPLAGCLKDPGLSEGGAITIEASIGAQTKVTTEGDVSAFADGDQIALYAWTGSASAVPDTRVVDGVVNTLGSGGWTPASEMRWKNLTDAHYFLGVNPVHTVSNFSAGEYELGTESYAAGDLLVATVLGEGRKDSDGAVPLAFKHVMARLSVKVTLVNTLSASDVSGVTVLAKNLAVVDYLAQTASASSSASASELPLFAMSTAASGYALSYSGPQVPQEGVKQITVKVAGVDYVYTSASDIPLESGKHTTVNLFVGKDRVELSGVSVSDWDTGNDFPAGEAGVVKPFFANNWLTFVSEGTTWLSLVNVGGNAPKLYYSTNTYDWTEWDYSELTFTSSAPLYLCGDNPDGFSASDSKYSSFVGAGSNYSVSGDIMSLLNKDSAIRVIPNNRCFCCLFLFCTHLTAAPELPATTLAEGCYERMFYGCTGLTAAPELPAIILADRCYYHMFVGCTNLSYVKCLATDIGAGVLEWLKDVAASGTFIHYPGATWPSGESGIPYGWTVQELITASRYLTFTSEGISKISLNNNGGNAPKLYYSYDTTDWTEWDYSELTFSYSTPLYLGGDNPDGFSRNGSKYSSFEANGDNFSVSGDIMSLIDKDAECKVIPNNNCFNELFSNCVLLTHAPELPATTLANNCYFSMFSGCTGLTTAPELSATTLADGCYYQMFRGCTGLTEAPKLPATTLANNCYFSMFSGCTSLTEAPKQLPATTLAKYCYNSMFSGCTGLTAAPELPATTLVDYCYEEMFSGCKILSYIKCLAVNTGDTTNTRNWLRNVADSGTFVKNANATWPSGVSGIPSGWDVQDSN